ncbi:hypothetical protein M885DRAFT_590380 [Pelagophyceae sp. CCMP2097]|nr:hypothetical protein M885DRAFT_590380 [Pelagophyceae sp. CCMP2097]
MESAAEEECVACGSLWPAAVVYAVPGCGHRACVGCTTQIVREALGDRARLRGGGVACIYPGCAARLGKVACRDVRRRGLACLPDARALYGTPAVPISALSASELERLEGAVAESARGAASRAGGGGRAIECGECGHFFHVPPDDGAATQGPRRVDCDHCLAQICSGCSQSWSYWHWGCEVPPSAPSWASSPSEAAAEEEALSARFIDATSRRCPACAAPTTHFHGHACHHISPASDGCARCRTHWCYSCGQTAAQNEAVRGRRGACACAGGSWSAYCKADDIDAYLVLAPYPHDARCGCPICPTCAPGRPCELCDGCVVCRGAVAPAPLELADHGAPAVAGGADGAAPAASWLTFDISTSWAALFSGDAPVAATVTLEADAPAAEALDAPEALEAAATPGPPRSPPRLRRGNSEALLLAAAAGRVDIFDEAWRRGGVDLEARDGRGQTALLAAAGRGHAAIVARLLARGADPKARDARSGCTPLLLACRRGSAGVVALLLRSARVDADAADAHGFTPLCCAAWKGHADAVAALLASDRRINRCYRIAGGLFAGHTALSLARLRGHKRAAMMLAIARPSVFALLPAAGRAALIRRACGPATQASG